MNSDSYFEDNSLIASSNKPYSIAASEAADLAAVAVQELANRLSIKDRNFIESDEEQIPPEHALLSSENAIRLSTCFSTHLDDAELNRFAPVTKDFGNHDSFGPEVLVFCIQHTSSVLIFSVVFAFSTSFFFFDLSNGDPNVRYHC